MTNLRHSEIRGGMNDCETIGEAFAMRLFNMKKGGIDSCRLLLI